MKISCNIIRDLLPLYAEDLASEDTRAMVEAHLCDCEDCTNVLNTMKMGTPVPIETTPEALNKVKYMIRRKRILSVMAALLTLITIASAVLTYLFTPFQLTMEQALDDFYVRDDGAVVIDYSPYVTGRSLSGMNENWFINQYSTRYDVWNSRNRKSIETLYGSDGVITDWERNLYENIDIQSDRWISSDGMTISNMPIPGDEGCRPLDGDADKNWWYFDPTGMGNDTLLHDAGKEFPQKEDRIQFAPMYPILFFGGILLALIFFAVNRFAKKPWLKELTMRFLILVSSLVVSILFVSNGRIFTAYVGVIDQYWGWFIGMDSVFLSLTILFWRQLHLLNRQDRAM